MPARPPRAYKWIALLGVLALLACVFLYDIYLGKTPDVHNLRELKLGLEAKFDIKKAVVRRYGAQRKNPDEQGLLITLYVNDDVFADADYCQRILQGAAEFSFDTFAPEPYSSIVSVKKQVASGCSTQTVNGPEKEIINPRRLATVKRPPAPVPAGK